jgi:hypothetical protein
MEDIVTFLIILSIMDNMHNDTQHNDAYTMTLCIVPLRIMTLSKTYRDILTLSMMILSKMTASIVTLRITTLRIRTRLDSTN